MHITEDSEIVMFHDVLLDRTTNGTGQILTQRYHGGLDQLVTTKSPQQKVGAIEEVKSESIARSHTSRVRSP